MQGKPHFITGLNINIKLKEYEFRYDFMLNITNKKKTVPLKTDYLYCYKIHAIPSNAQMI